MSLSTICSHAVYNQNVSQLSDEQFSSSDDGYLPSSSEEYDSYGYPINHIDSWSDENSEASSSPLSQSLKLSSISSESSPSCAASSSSETLSTF